MYAKNIYVYDLITGETQGKRLLNLKLPKEITKDNLVKSKKILGNIKKISYLYNVTK